MAKTHIKTAHWMIKKHSIARRFVQRTQTRSKNTVSPLEVDALIAVIAGEWIGIVEVILRAP